MFSFKFEKALPYLLGGAFFYMVYRKVFFRNVEYIEEKTTSAKVRYLTMSDSEKDSYALKQANLIGSILSTRIGSSFRNNDDIVALIKGNNFCIVRIGRKWGETHDGLLHLSLSNFLAYSLSHSDFIRIYDEIEELRLNEY